MAELKFHFPQVNIVRASAGSGKTYQLTKRYVQLIFITCRQHPQALKEVLAITFTNKAAQQMKARILDFLKRASLQQLKEYEVDDILKPIDITVSEAATLAERLLDYILRSYHYFAVQTIDSFVNALLAGCAFKIGLSAKFRIQRNSFDYLQLGLDELLVKSSHDKATRDMFERFIKQYLFLENRGGWLPKEELLGTLITLYRQANMYGVPLATSKVGSEDVWSEKKAFYESLAYIHHQDPQGLKKIFAQSLTKFVQERAQGFDIDDVSNFLVHEEFPVLKNTEVSDAVLKQWAKARQQLNDICLSEAFGVYNPYIYIYNALMTSLARLQTRDDVLFLEQLNQKARLLFDHQMVSVSELYYRLAARFKHYLIDEFQDTSQTQWRNLQLMIEETLASDGSLFLVGDVKQAIYGFRGGDNQLFDTIEAQYAPIVLNQTLDINRRSQRAIIEFNNEIFSADNLKRFIQDMRSKTDDAITVEREEHILHVFEAAHQQVRAQAPHGYVRVNQVLGQSKEREAHIYEQMLETLADVRQRFILSDIAIVVRSNAQVQLVTGWLMAEGIAVESERTSDILAYPLTNELMAFLRFLSDPNDDVSFALFLLGQAAPAAFGIPHATLADFCFQHRRVRNQSQANGLYHAFQEQYPDIATTYIDQFINRIGFYPLYELMISIYRTYQLQTNFPDGLGFLMHFLEIIKMKEEETVDVVAFIEAFEKIEEELRFIPLPKMDAIRVLTVHKAKGLEFPVVILPFLEMSLKVGASAHQGHQSFSLLINEENMSLVRLKKKYAQFSPVLKRLWDLEYNKSLLNELCTMYVALTRAVWEMHIFVPEKAGNAANPALSLIAPESFPKGSPVKGEVEHDLQPTPSLDPLALSDWLPLLREDIPAETSLVQHAKLRGKLWHEILSQIEFLPTDNQIDTYIRNLATAVYAKAGRAASLEEDLPRFIDFIKRKDVRPLFTQASDVKVFREMELVNRFGDLKRIDRLLVSPTHITLIDFKTSPLAEKSHREQLDEYYDLVKALYPKHSIEGRLIYIEGVE